jgi:hypothetical protein
MAYSRRMKKNMNFNNLGAFMTVIYPNNAQGSWWSAGGISAENCIAAFQPKGAASLAASYVNLASGGATWDAATGNEPTFAAETGWTFNGSNDYLVVGSGAILTAPPLTIVALVRTSNMTASKTIAAIKKTTANTGWQMATSGAIAGDPIRMQSMLNGSSAYADSTSGYLENTWHVAAGGSASHASRAAFIDGGSMGTDTTTKEVSEDVDITLIGATHNGAQLTGWFEGDIAALAFYNAAITQTQIAAVAAAMAAL